MKGKLIEFMVDNKLNFNGSGSGLNSSCTIISGYALHIGANVGEIKEAITETFPKANNYQKELERVFDFANRSNYQDFWKKDEAKEMYKF